MASMMKFHRKLQYLTRHRGLSQAEVARRMGVPETRVSEWALGKAPSLAKDLAFGLAMARALDVSLEYLADEAQEGEPPAVPDRWEMLVRDMVASQPQGVGWKWVVWKLVGANNVPPVEHTSPTFGETHDAARVMAEHVKQRDAAQKMADQQAKRKTS